MRKASNGGQSGIHRSGELGERRGRRTVHRPVKDSRRDERKVEGVCLLTIGGEGVMRGIYGRS